MKSETKSEYQRRKELAREKAIEWQREWCDEIYSYGELVLFTDYFEKVGRRYGLTREFRENGII